MPRHRKILWISRLGINPVAWIGWSIMRFTAYAWFEEEVLSFVKQIAVFLELPMWAVEVLFAGLILIASMYWLFISIRKNEQNELAWQVYGNLSEEFRNLMFATEAKDRADIYALIEKERDKLPDTGLDKIIDEDILGVERERAHWNMNSYCDEADAYLSEGLKNMRNYFKRKYGGRGHDEPTKQ